MDEKKEKSYFEQWVDAIESIPLKNKKKIYADVTYKGITATVEMNSPEGQIFTKMKKFGIEIKISPLFK